MFFYHTHTKKNIQLEFKANFIFYNLKIIINKKFSQICTHFQIERAEKHFHIWASLGHLHILGIEIWHKCNL